MKGDSGGPLIFEKDGIFYQVGVVSYTKVRTGIDRPYCPSKGEPQMFTRLSSLRDFILNAVATTGGASSGCGVRHRKPPRLGGRPPGNYCASVSEHARPPTDASAQKLRPPQRADELYISVPFTHPTTYPHRSPTRPPATSPPH
ncbi:hypothetical protein BIW11_09010 [Tropilaelaps mercedesae]|uniref:Uncharacterized protein n=1 Tax=Tropilaelaps mercedesae TaxID=418985 RepID=A0A1V9XM81_9ACAR|nr:hypothetical protein BIW11_09010 [Tropilaelaps mercedesae]